jgi:23S rRNA U2552 (ribose-2'-O)-methylase RlmE/FtsJ
MFAQKKYVLNDMLSDVDEQINVKLYKKKEPDLPKEEYGFDNKLNEYRDNIDNINNDLWKKIRWYINEYDFVVKDPIINRAFYKYWEIINKFNIFKEYNVSSDLILHCAEAPGGFIQGTNLFLQIEKIEPCIKKNKEIIDEDGFTVIKKNQKNNKYKIYTISLNKECSQYKQFNLPSYNKDVMNKHIYLSFGYDNTGDINNIINIDHIYKKSKKLFYLITGDGGFDEGCNFNNKEQLHYNLILNEVYSAIKLQMTNGHFILKMFDIYTDTSIHLLYLLSLCYKEVFIYKPITSRPTNSEKYIICKYFNCDDNNRSTYIDKLKYLSNMLLQSIDKTAYISFTLFNEIPLLFVEKIKNINMELLDRQCLFLEKAITLCNDNEFLDNYSEKYTESMENRKQVYKQWESYYNLNAYI